MSQSAPKSLLTHQNMRTHNTKVPLFCSETDNWSSQRRRSLNDTEIPVQFGIIETELAAG